MFPVATIRSEKYCDFAEFKARLAVYANTYVDEVAKPLMIACDELWEDDAIVYLVFKWYDEHKAARVNRLRYLCDFSRSDGQEPYEFGSWHRENERVLRTTLDALLIHEMN